MRILFLLFIIIPILEMYLLIRVGQAIGAWPTIGLVLLTAVIGINLLRYQGLSTLLRGRQRLDAGELPAVEILEGMVLAVSGALLLTPGFATDAIGLAGLIPPLRQAMVRQLLGRVTVVGGQQPPHSAAPNASRDTSREKQSHTLEGEYWKDE